MSLPQLFFSGTYNNKDCPIAMVEYKPYNLENYIELNDYSDFISENKERNYEELSHIISGKFRIYGTTGVYYNNNSGCYPVYKNPDYIYFSSGSFLVTDIVAPNISKLPLFFQHRLQYDIYCEEKNPENYIYVRLNGEDLLDKNTYILEYGNYSLTSSGNLNKNDMIWTRIKPAGNYFRCRILFPYSYNYNDFYEIEYPAYINGSQEKRTELINRTPIYSENIQYNITSSGVTINQNVNDSIITSGNIYLQKNYKSRIFFKPFDRLLSSSGTSKWNLTLNPGTFIQLSGLFSNNNITYNINNENSIVIVSGEYPNIYNQNTLKTTKFPIYIYSSGYPTYEIISGFNIYINNELLENKYIHSWDEEKGFVKLKRNMLSTDIVSVNYNINRNENFIIENLDLNPKNFNKYKILNDGISFAVSSSEYYPSGLIFYKTSENKTSNFSNSTYGWKTSSNENDTYSGLLGLRTKIIGQLEYKSLPKDILTITDCRRLGGGLVDNKSSEESEWYYDRGKWDGEILQSNSCIIIQIPSGVQNYFIDKFYTHGNFSKENYNEQILLESNYDTILNNLNFDNLKYHNAIKEANKYIINCINRYLPVGTEYMIMDQNYRIWDPIT